MSFQFVNITADKRTPDAETRKQIRSQVMKDYRKRKGNDTSTMDSAENETAGSSHSAIVQSRLPRRTSEQASQQSSSESLTTLPSGVPGERSGRRGRPSRSEQDRYASLFLQTAHGLFSNFTIRLRPKDINVSRPGFPETGLSHDDVDSSRMLAICDRFNTWLGWRETRAAPLLARQRQLDTSLAMQRLYALTLLSIGHLDALGAYEGEHERAYYKARLLEYVTRSLQDQYRACADSTIAALACLTSYEVSFGSHEALTHLSGIARIVHWRGGLSSIYDDSLVLLLQMLDLLHAVYFQVEPMLTTADSTWHLQTTSFSSADDCAVAARDWQDQLREAASYLHNQDNLSAARACHLAWRILLCQPKEHEVWSQEALVMIEELHKSMRNTDTWSAQPALQARVLLTGLSTATDPSQKSWYYTSLSHLMFYTQAQHWNDFQGLVMALIESQAYYRRPVMQTVRAMVSGVEIVIERSLAAQLGLQTVSSCVGRV